ncbi:MAG TPA: preprotein translocase subunit SecE [Steroidobacteraceae bacterium]
MNEQVEGSPTALDAAKLALGVLVFVAGIAGFYYLGEQPPVVRWLIVLAAFGAAVGIALQSQYGRDFSQFVQTSRIELRKVVWPNRQDTLQTTIVVLVFVLVSGLFFWLLDMVLAWVTKQLTGQGG